MREKWIAQAPTAPVCWRGIHQPLFMANKRRGREWFVFRWDTANLEYVREEWFGFFLYLGHCCGIRWWIVVRLWRKQHRFTHGECGCVHGHPGMLGADKVSNRAITNTRMHRRTHLTCSRIIAKAQQEQRGQCHWQVDGRPRVKHNSRYKWLFSQQAFFRSR